MPSSSWRSHLLPSCSVAELQEIADGECGFSIPKDPCNQVYPGIYLGDAYVFFRCRLPYYVDVLQPDSVFLLNVF